MAADDMPNFTIQRGSRIYQGYASIALVQRLHVSRGQEGGRCGLEPQRCASPSFVGETTLMVSQNLQSAEEMEEEERVAQSAKLQELIRRGGPEDLQEANRLMKVMAGYDTRHKTDYRAKAAEEVAKVQQKAKILEEMLQGYKEGDKLNEGDVFEVGSSRLFD